jgi:2-polyprenyl-3-methyl-5-hydroxy-6-metoxy-1,4-benzoquinol methylase
MNNQLQNLLNEYDRLRVRSDQSAVGRLPVIGLPIRTALRLALLGKVWAAERQLLQQLIVEMGNAQSQIKQIEQKPAPAAARIAAPAAVAPPSSTTPTNAFHSEHYLRHNQRRQEHLASLRLPLENQSVLELGAGIGDHTSFFLDRGCRVLTTEARTDNLQLLQQRFQNKPNVEVQYLNLEAPTDLNRQFDIVYSYGILYHLPNPEQALAFMANHTRGLLLLETCVSYGSDEQINPVIELERDPTQSVTGKGCRPTRPWIFTQLRKLFQHVYMPITQPYHEEFPVNWHVPTNQQLTRSVFVASRQPIDNALLSETLLMTQSR